jgi:Fur family ferric uptake transcriptional regulator
MQDVTTDRGDLSAASQPRIPLALARPGESVELVAVRGGAGLQRRLAEMGLGKGSRFAVETGGRRGPFVVRVKGSRLIPGYGMVTRIFVCPVPPRRSERAKR